MPTANGLGKSILDATFPIRTLLKEAGIHDYMKQSQGPANKVVRAALFVSPRGPLKAEARLYRPVTKNGDPRIWFPGLPAFTRAENMLGLFIYEGTICVVDLSAGLLNSRRNDDEILGFLEVIRRGRDIVSVELLARLRVLAANGRLRAVCEGDTAVGRTVEYALGIPQNSSKAPDYHGIELKSYRAKGKGRENRAGLFAQVPDWSRSHFGRSGDFLRAFGYERKGIRRLYCTVSALKANSQGLRFRLDADDERLVEVHEPTRQDCAQWELSLLHQCLLNKHKETFWIRALSEVDQGTEHFSLLSVRHTERPSIVQFDALLGSGSVTMDHTIKETPSGGAEDKGYLFKLKKRDLAVLFPAPRDYLLTEVS